MCCSISSSPVPAQEYFLRQGKISPPRLVWKVHDMKVTDPLWVARGGEFRHIWGKIVCRRES